MLRGEQVTAAAARSPVGAGSLLLDACHRELVRIGRATPRQPFPNKKLFDQAARSADLVFGHILESLGDKKMKLPQQMYAADAVAGVLVRWLPTKLVSAKGVLLNIDKVPVALDAAFPGYARAGLLSQVLRKRRKT